MQVLITRLTKAFLNLDRTSSTNVDCLLTKVAGQELAMLATDNVHNCLVMLKEPEFINKLKHMILIHDEKYIYVAATLLCRMCQHALAKLTESDLKELCETLHEVSPATSCYICNQYLWWIMVFVVLIYSLC